MSTRAAPLARLREVVRRGPRLRLPRSRGRRSDRR